MNNKYTTSLELSKELKEAGITRTSEFYWVEFDDGKEWLSPIYELSSITYDGEYSTYSAFLTDELGEILKAFLSNMSTWDSATSQWIAYYKRRPSFSEGEYFSANTEAECRGKLLLYLAEQGLLKKGNHE